MHKVIHIKSTFIPILECLTWLTYDIMNKMRQTNFFSRTVIKINGTGAYSGVLTVQVQYKL